MIIQKIQLTIIFVLVFVLLSLNLSVNAIPDESNDCRDYIVRIDSLEPVEPKNIDSTAIYDLPLPTKLFTVQEVLKSGKNIEKEYVYSDDIWKKPAYRTYWHSTISDGRWSEVPRRINYATHNIFTSYLNAANIYSFLHEVGIHEESKSFNWSKNMGLDNLLLVTMKSKVQRIVTYGNQVVVVAEPSRTGLQVLLVPQKEIVLVDKQSPIMFQLVTPDGYEIDYSLISKW